MPDRRKTNRFNIPVPVILQGGVGLTHDISDSGVYIETNQRFESTDGLLSFSLCFGESEDDPAWLYRCSGKVLRTESLVPSGTGIAVTFVEVSSVENIHNRPTVLC